MSSIARRQKREKKRKVNIKIDSELSKIKKQNEIKEKAQQLFEQQRHSQSVLQHTNNPQQKSSELIINYIADRNGCGYFRCIWPFELLATYKNVLTINSFIYHTEPSTLAKAKMFRFQRQATTVQTNAWFSYFHMRQKNGLKFKMQYEIDDLLMEIEPHNKIAYEYFDKEKKDNHLKMLHSADSIVFSTEALKDIYVKDYNINAEKICVVRNHLPQFLYSLPYRHTPKDFKRDQPEKRPRIFWSGSASHLGPDGDLAFLIPMIIKTRSEYKWVFQGVVPE